MPIDLLRTSFFTNTATLHSSPSNQNILKTWTQITGRPDRPLTLNTQRCLAYQKVHQHYRKREQLKNTSSNSQHNRRQRNQTTTHASRHCITIRFLFGTKNRLYLSAHTLHERNQARGKTTPPSRQARPADSYYTCAEKQAQEAPRR